MKTDHEIKKSLMLRLIFSVAVLAPFSFFLGIYIGYQVKGFGKFNDDSIPSWVSAVSTAVIAGLTIILALETWKLRVDQMQQLKELKRENIRPNVGVQLESSRSGVNFINVKLSNLGKGIARNISFKFLDKKGNPADITQDIVVEKFLKLGLFKMGVESLGIGQVISNFVFSFNSLGNKIGGDIFNNYLNIVINFEDVEGFSYVNVFTIDFAQFKGGGTIGEDPFYKMATELGEIRKSIGSVTGNSNSRVGVNVYSESDRQQETEKNRKQYEARQRPPSA